MTKTIVTITTCLLLLLPVYTLKIKGLIKNEQADLRAQFAAFVNQHGKNYQNATEFEQRLAKFTKNVNAIEKHNSEDAPALGFELGVN